MRFLLKCPRTVDDDTPCGLAIHVGITSPIPDECPDGHCFDDDERAKLAAQLLEGVEEYSDSTDDDDEAEEDDEDEDEEFWPLDE